MILSLEHKLIFLRTKKTAGTSIELALSELCGPDDIITPLTREDEARRAGRRGAQNWRMHSWWMSPRVQGVLSCLCRRRAPWRRGSGTALNRRRRLPGQPTERQGPRMSLGHDASAMSRGEPANRPRGIRKPISPSVRVTLLQLWLCTGI